MPKKTRVEELKEEARNEHKHVTFQDENKLTKTFSQSELVSQGFFHPNKLTFAEKRSLSSTLTEEQLLPRSSTPHRSRK